MVSTASVVADSGPDLQKIANKMRVLLKLWLNN